jgi:hypothetical protein
VQPSPEITVTHASAIRPRLRAWTAALLALVLTATGLSVGATAASAATGDVAGATLDWGIKASFRSYITGPIAAGGWTVEGGVTDSTPFGWSGGSGTADESGATVSVSYPGSVHFVGHGGALDILFADVSIVRSSGSAATLYVDTATSTDVPLATLDLAAGTSGSAAGTVAYSGVPATLTADGATAFGGFYSEGTALDPVSFTWPVEQAAAPTATSTALAVAPTGSSASGESVTLTATVSPAADGAVQFLDGSTAVGDPVAVVAGQAAHSGTAFAVGDHSFSAVFTPTDAAAFASSSSAAVAHTVTAAAGTTDTAVAVTVSPAPSAGAPVPLGTSVTVSATVTAEDSSAPRGSVEFFAVPASGGPAVSLGSGAVSAGVASVSTTALAAGGHTFRADFNPAAGYAASSGTTTANFGVVDTATPTVCTPGPTATTVSGIDAAWDYSAYSSEWTKTATGAIRVDGQTFLLSDGVATMDDDCAVVQFTGTLRVSAYASFFPTEGQWVQLVDPVLTIGSDGSGSWAATVRTGAATFTGTEPATFRTVATLTGQQFPDLSASTSLAFDYAGTTAKGTWNANYSDAWANGFVLAVPSAIRAFYFRSGDSAANLRKPPAPLTIGNGTPLATTTSLAASAPTATEGGSVVLTATISPAAAGTVTFADGATTVGTAPVAGGTAILAVSSLTAGTHAFTASFTPTSPRYGASRSGSVAVTVASAGTTAPSAGSLQWGIKTSFNNYVSGPIAQGTIRVADDARVVGGTYWFPQSGASGIDAAGLGTVSYRGSVSYSGHSGALALTIADPSVRIASLSTAVVSVAGPSGRIDFATVDLGAASRSTDSSGAITYSGAPTTLTAAGAELFAGFYPAGTALDPLTFVVGSTNSSSAAPAQAAAFPAPRQPAATPPATTGVSIDTKTLDNLAEGGEVSITAEGYESNETGILVVIYSTPVVLARDVTADANGVVTWTGRLPAGLTGSHTLTVQGSVDRGIVIDIAPRITTAAEGCPVDAATLTWGFKESFRSYISGSIANGEWTVADGATYTTPEFGWSDGKGAYDPDGGLVQFPGSVNFTGHGGILNTTIASPQLRFIDEDTAVLLLDVSGTTQDGAAVDQQDVEFVELDLAGAVERADGSLTVTDAPAVLTSAGAAAFGTYPAGEEFDPVSFTLALDPACATAVEPTEAQTMTAEPVASGADLTWLWVVLAAVLLLLVAAAVVVIVVRRGRNAE